MPVTRRQAVLALLAASAALVAIVWPASGGAGPTAQPRVLRDCPVVPARRIASVIGPLRTRPAPVFEVFTFRDRTELDCEATNRRAGNAALWVRIDASCASPQRNRQAYNASWNMARRDAKPTRLSGLGTAAFTMSFAGIRWLSILTNRAFMTVRLMQGGTRAGPLASALALGRSALGFDCRVRG